MHNVSLTTPPPDRPRLSLGWRLALSTALIITVVMGVISVGQQFLAIEQDRAIHKELVQMSLAPLAVRLEAASSLNEMQEILNEFHAAYRRKGYTVNILLSDDRNKMRVSSGDAGAGETDGEAVHIDIAVVSPLLSGGQGQLSLREDIVGTASAARRSWGLWLAHFAVTVIAVSVFIAVSIHFQVTRPVSRLLAVVRKMEMGYWRPIEVDAGAWEIRWLAWRFGNMVQEVRETTKRLFQAERKALELISMRSGKEAEIESAGYEDRSHTPNDRRDRSEYAELAAVCRRLEGANADDPPTLALAESAWNGEALRANRLGFHELKVRLEDAALRLMEPESYSQIHHRLEDLKGEWHGWAERNAERMRQGMSRHAIPCVALLHRVKHTAGAWAKMRNKGLKLEEVYDLFAFRVIVPTEADCYAALGIIHGLFEPDISRFKDYIAKPKGNGYRSLHTCVRTEEGPTFEVQIRSIAMDQQAELGGAAHWSYKKETQSSAGSVSTPAGWQRVLRSMFSRRRGTGT